MRIHTNPVIPDRLSYCKHLGDSLPSFSGASLPAMTVRERNASLDGVPAVKLTPAQLQERAARNLTWAREMLFPSQAAAARKFGLNPVTYGRYETGDRKISVPLLVEICAGEWGLTLDYFYRSDLSAVNPPLALRLSAEHPVLLQECAPRDIRGAPWGREEAVGKDPPSSARIPGKVKAPTA